MNCLPARMLKRFVYVLKTEEGAPRFYVGVTSNVQQRLVAQSGMLHAYGKAQTLAGPRGG